VLDGDTHTVEKVLDEMHDVFLRYPAGGTADAANVPPRQDALRRASSSTIRMTSWLYDSRVPLGAITLVGGYEGLGKTTWGAHAARRDHEGTLPGALRDAARRDGVDRRLAIAHDRSPAEGSGC